MLSRSASLHGPTRHLSITALQRVLLRRAAVTMTAPAGGPPGCVPLADACFFRPARIEDLDAVYALEVAGYPPDEAATFEKLKFRIENAGAQFLVAEKNGAVIGFTCGTLAPAGRLTHSSMSSHEPKGTTLCVHSVCVAAAERRRGVASRMLAAYLLWAQMAPSITEVRLICKDNLIGLYQRAGFELVGPSDVVHGAEPWFEMVHALPAQAVGMCTGDACF